MPELAEACVAQSNDAVSLLGTDYVEFYVGNAVQAAHFYRTALGMRWIGYLGPETGVRDRVSYVLSQGKIRFVVTAALKADHPAADHVHRHGDGVRAIALTVEDAAAAYAAVKSRGARIVEELRTIEDAAGRVQTFSIAAYGDTVHTFIDRSRYRSDRFLPGYEPVRQDALCRPTGLVHIDHIVGNVGWGQMDQWAAFYRDILGFTLYQSFDDKDISTEYSALMSKVMAGGGGRIKFPINEPARGRRKSQVEEFLEYYGGPGVQHIALATANIIETVTRLREQGVDFLPVPAAYYEQLSERVSGLEESFDDIRALGILVDSDAEGHLLQIFTRPVQDRPTLFFEIIERRGSRGFGKGNFKALFEAIEREQARRGNL